MQHLMRFVLPPTVGVIAGRDYPCRSENLVGPACPACLVFVLTWILSMILAATKCRQRRMAHHQFEQTAGRLGFDIAGFVDMIRQSLSAWTKVIAHAGR